ncbi:MAG: type II secretion system secretin GspD [Deltaproteobacteria bacterium]|nr:MAG: type II secretion system secretin GspD [Deltaproteobacteria bacterium]
MKSSNPSAARKSPITRPRNHLHRWLPGLVLAAVLSVASLGQAQEQGDVSRKPKANKTISMDFDQVDIKVFIKFISELTGINFVVDDKVRGKVTILSPTKISVDEAYRVFQSVLEVNGFTTVKAGKVTKVIPSAAARQKSIETRKKPLFVPRPQDQVVTQLVPLVYADSQDIRKLLAPLVSKQGVVVAYDPTDTLIITDFQSNIQRLLRIIEEVDVEFREATITVLSLEYASAEKLAQKITQLVETQRKGTKARRVKTAPPLKIVPDERINVLVILADRGSTEMIEELVKNLDRPTPKGAGNVQVIYLENADAEELAKTLSGLATKAVVKGKEPIISAEVKIVADKATNSLVITAKAEEFQVIDPIIQKLDIPRKQVFVEALIMEISSDTTFSLGVNWSVAGTTTIGGKEGAVFLGSNPGGGTNLVQGNQLAIPGGLSLGALTFPTTLTVNGTDILINNLAALINAAQTDSAFNIISTPQLMTLDNEEATVVVADNIPFSTRVDQGDQVTSRAIQSFEYRDVGVTLKVTPQINEKRFVKLRIFQEVSRVVQSAVTSGDQTLLAPTTRKRTAETLVEVADSQTVVIAGLLGDDSDSAVSKVPCLGDTPVLGWLFKTVDETERRTNLLIFLTPHIIASPAEASEIYREKARHMEDVRQGTEGEAWPMESPAAVPAEVPTEAPAEVPTKVPAEVPAEVAPPEPGNQ